MKPEPDTLVRVQAAPPSGDRPGNPDLFRSVLASVSRSFYLTIRVLPAPVRRPIGLAYLLARTSDTVADSAGVPVALRLRALRLLGEAIRERGPLPSPEEMAALTAGVSDPSERTLLSHTATLVDLLHASEPGDRHDVVRVLEVIFRGQELDLERFETGEEPGAVDKKPVRALADAGELDDYTYRVAGCVGEFWTRLCNRRLENYARLGEEEMIRLGIAFGKGLQLVNILRDAPADLAHGRCYFPLDELEAAGLVPSALSRSPEKARPLFDRWIATARSHLGSGFRYLEAVRPWRLRLACFLPWALGMKTLVLLERTPPLESAQRVKVARSEVKRLLVWGILAGSSNALLHFFEKKFRK